MTLLERYIKKLQRWKDRLEDHEKLYNEAVEEENTANMETEFFLKLKFQFEIPMIEKFIEDLREEQEQLKIISCTEAAFFMGTDKETVRNLVKSGKLKNYGNESRFMVNKFDIIDIRLGKKE